MGRGIRRPVFQRDLCPDSCLFYGLMTWSNLFLLLCQWTLSQSPASVRIMGVGDFVSCGAPRLACWGHVKSFLRAPPAPPLGSHSGRSVECLVSRKASSLSKGLSFPQMGGCAGPKFFFPFGQFDWAGITECFLTKHYLPTVRQG